MPEVIKDGDTTADHGNFDTDITGKSNVKVGGASVVRVDDGWANHDSDPTHTDVKQSTGSTKVFANGKGIARVGDDIVGNNCATNNTSPTTSSKVNIGP